MGFDGLCRRNYMIKVDPPQDGDHSITLFNGNRSKKFPQGFEQEIQEKLVLGGDFSFSRSGVQKEKDDIIHYHD